MENIEIPVCWNTVITCHKQESRADQKKKKTARINYPNDKDTATMQIK